MIDVEIVPLALKDPESLRAALGNHASSTVRFVHRDRQQGMVNILGPNCRWQTGRLLL